MPVLDPSTIGGIMTPDFFAHMKFRKLGGTGLDVSEIGFGAWAIGGSWGPQSESDSVAALNRALDLGVNLIDTAAGYGDGKSERIIAAVLKGRRESVVIATKTPPVEGPWPPSPYCVAAVRYPEEYLRKNVEDRLRNLGTDRLDILQLHTWTRAWNRDPAPFEVLRAMKKEGKVRFVGVSTPEHDQNSVIDLMRGGWVDVVQVIYNIFEQEPAAELLPVAAETGTGIIVRVVFDEGSLTGKWTGATTFPEGDFRRSYFEGDRLGRAVARAAKVSRDVDGSGYTLPQAAIAFALAHGAVGTVIPGMRSVSQAEANCGVSALPPMSEELLARLRPHNWRRAFWYGGK
jgi:aryl-alcohol dehydrogenase-like predicted oxidoreductase